MQSPEASLQLNPPGYMKDESENSDGESERVWTGYYKSGDEISGILTVDVPFEI